MAGIGMDNRTLFEILSKSTPAPPRGPPPGSDGREPRLAGGGGRALRYDAWPAAEDGGRGKPTIASPWWASVYPVGMAWIRTIDEGEAQGHLAELYRRFGNPAGSVDNVLKVHSLNPESLEAHCGLYVQCMHRSSPVSRAEREMIGVTVSRLNGCGYCLEHHARGLERLLRGERADLVAGLKRGETDELTSRERAMVEYAAKLTRSPRACSQADVDALRGAGLEDREILDVAQVAAYFAYVNRIVLGLGAALEPDGELGQWPEGAGG